MQKHKYLHITRKEDCNQSIVLKLPLKFNLINLTDRTPPVCTPYRTPPGAGGDRGSEPSRGGGDFDKVYTNTFT
jgi:hypothetical protein